MGRAFEYRKARKLKRWGSMSRTFTRLGKELTIAAKEGGTDPKTIRVCGPLSKQPGLKHA